MSKYHMVSLYSPRVWSTTDMEASEQNAELAALVTHLFSSTLPSSTDKWSSDSERTIWLEDHDLSRQTGTGNSNTI